MTVLLNNLTDLSVEANREDARAELSRCFSDDDYARWARTYGEAALIALDEIPAACWED